MKKDPIELYPIPVQVRYGSIIVSIVKDEYIQHIRITKNEYNRILVRSGKEFKPVLNTFWHRVKLAWRIIFSS